MKKNKGSKSSTYIYRGIGRDFAAIPASYGLLRTSHLAVHQRRPLLAVHHNLAEAGTMTVPSPCRAPLAYMVGGSNLSSIGYDVSSLVRSPTIVPTIVEISKFLLKIPCSSIPHLRCRPPRSFFWLLRRWTQCLSNLPFFRSRSF